MECGMVKCDECGMEVDEKEIRIIGDGVDPDEAEVCKQCWDYLNTLAIEEGGFFNEKKKDKDSPIFKEE